MCGIVGYIGKNDASKVILDGLKTLEYRGYDSWGVATVGNPSLHVFKKVGKIGDTEKIALKKSRLGVGHTRWATHGGVTENNAHPHVSGNGKIAVVHNGIIENYQALRKELEEKGCVFKSETDTEIIPHLIEDYMKQHSFGMAFKKTVERLEGLYAVLAIHLEHNAIIAARKGSPLVLGIGEGEYFLASDVTAFLSYTKKVIFIEDNELVVANDVLEIINIKTDTIVEKKMQEIGWDIEKSKKGSFDHFMMKEIHDQKETILNAMNHDSSRIDEIADKVNSSFGTFFVASGSSYYAVLSASYLFSKIAKKHINVVDASEFPYYRHFLTDRTLMIAVSQSGETADLLEAVKAAKEKKSKIFSIVNVMGSTLMRNSDYTLLMNAGPEICVLSTKSYTSQVAILTLLAYASVGKLEEGKKTIKSVSENVKYLLGNDFVKSIETLAHIIKDTDHIFTIGRGVSYPTALEAALKIKEVSYIHAEGFTGGFLKHGTIALIEKGTPCIVFAPDDETRKDVLNNAVEIKSRGGYIIGVSAQDNEIFDYHIKVPDVPNAAPILHIIPIQILSYFLAVLRGCDPDKPRNLAKSVTVK